MIPYFFHGSGMYRKHPNHTYGRNRNNSANNWAIEEVILEAKTECYAKDKVKSPPFF